MTTPQRRDRLLHLMHRGPTTVPALADTLEVSARTVYRDISALRDAGHDIRASAGRGGGVRIAPDSRPRAVHFEVSEIIGLALSVAILRATPHAPFARSAEAALDRARHALPSDRQRAIQRLQRRILIGSPASKAVLHTLGAVEDTLLTVFEACFTSSLAMAFDYVDSCGSATSRRIECIALVLHAPAWYILAWDLHKDAPRMFRMDRIAHAVRGDALTHTHLVEEATAQACPEAQAAYTGWVGVPIG